MTIDEKYVSAHTNDMGLAATAIRLRAAFIATGLEQQNDLAREAGISKTVLSNALAGASHPNRNLMKYLYRAHRIDFNFVMNGDFSQLPADVQDRLFHALEIANSEWDQREGSDRAQAKQQPSQS